MTVKSRYWLGGEVKEGFVYAKRSREYKIISQLINENCFINVTGPRQTGKSSFVRFSMRTIQEILGDQIVSIKLDLRHDLGNPDGPNKHRHEKDFVNTIIFILGRKVKLSIEEIDNWIHARHNYESNTSFLVTFFIEKIVPTAKGKRLLLVIDELDKLLKWGPYRDSFIESLILLAENRDTLNLSIITISVSSPSFLFAVLPQGDFKVAAYSIPISDFDYKEKDVIKDWISGLDHLNSEDKKHEIGQYVLEYTGGQPRLTAKIFDHIVRNHLSELEEIEKYVENEIVKKAFYVNTQDYEYFKIPEEFIMYKPDLSSQALKIWKDLLDGELKVQVTDKALHIILLGSGLISTHHAEYISIRNKIFRKIYDKDWIELIKKKINELQLNIRTRNSADSIRSKEASRIAIINLGGTIGMIEKNSIVTQPDLDDFYNMYPFLEEVVDFDYISYDKITDGANIYPEDWEQIAKLIYENRDSGYSGFIIMHGTDTLSYTASAIAFALGENLSFPVVFVGAQAIHNAYHGDAQPNLARAVKVASMDIPEVVIVFGDNIYRAVRAEKSSDYLFQGFSSNTQSPLGIITEKVEINTEIIRRHPISKGESFSKRILTRQYDIQLKNRFETNVLKISQIPGLNVGWYKKMLDEFEIKGILIESLGLGNLPHLSGNATDRKYNLIPLIEYAQQNFIPVMVTSKFPIRPDFVDKYQPARSVIEAGAIWAGNLTSIAAQTKFMWLLPQLESIDKRKSYKNYKNTLRELLHRNYIGEIDNVKKQNDNG